MNLDGKNNNKIYIQNQLIQDHKGIQRCRANINRTRQERDTVSKITPFERKFFKELEEAYKREKRE